MHFTRISRASINQIGIEGILMVLATVPFILASLNYGDNPLPIWSLVTTSAASILCFSSAFLFFRRPPFGQILAGLSLICCFSLMLPYFAHSPFAALIGSISALSAGFFLINFQFKSHQQTQTISKDRCLQRVYWATITTIIIIVCSIVIRQTDSLLASGAVAVSAVINQILLIHWFSKQKTGVNLVTFVSLSVIISVVLLLLIQTEHTHIAGLLSCILTLVILPHPKRTVSRYESWWDIILNNPARVLLATFSGLCFLGTFLLLIPEATTLDHISFIDSAFTAVSAVCVTGLIVLDTPNDSTGLGQFFIILLIQLGGLGIMGIATVALHSMGRRLSLHQERLLTTMTDTNHKDLVESLITILKFVFIAEGIGTIILSILFFFSGDSLFQAIWRGLFTSISAFCNAGFALQSDSLIPYQQNPLILHTVALLIIVGGVAPAVALIIPKWLTRKPVSTAARISLITTVALLFSGTFFMLAFEWNGILSGLPIVDKIHNAWFQSVTLRTAGFNSVDIAAVFDPTLIIMICFMFIGGSPGGTAGGVKTTTIGILVMTFWANITNRDDVVIQNRRISPKTINRALTIVVSGVIFWFVIVLMLQVTQQIDARNLIFEATSAIGTVGLSTGATGHLDEIGKFIIIIAMFAGRIGPMSLFMLLGDTQTPGTSRYPEAKITLS